MTGQKVFLPIGLKGKGGETVEDFQSRDDLAKHPGSKGRVVEHRGRPFAPSPRRDWPAPDPLQVSAAPSVRDRTGTAQRHGLESVQSLYAYSSRIWATRDFERPAASAIFRREACPAASRMQRSRSGTRASASSSWSRISRSLLRGSALGICCGGEEPGASPYCNKWWRSGCDRASGS